MNKYLAPTNEVLLFDESALFIYEMKSGWILINCTKLCTFGRTKQYTHESSNHIFPESKNEGLF